MHIHIDIRLFWHLVNYTLFTLTKRCSSLRMSEVFLEWTDYRLAGPLIWHQIDLCGWVVFIMQIPHTVLDLHCKLHREMGPLTQAWPTSCCGPLGLCTKDLPQCVYSLFTLRKPRFPFILSGERGFLRVNRLYSLEAVYKGGAWHALTSSMLTYSMSVYPLKCASVGRAHKHFVGYTNSQKW